MPDYTITELKINYERLTQLPNDIHLYTNLKILDCSYNEITQLDNLPQGLKELNCHSNNITQLDNLPVGLKILDCSYNKISQLNNLPASLEKLYCYINPLIYDFEPTLKNIKKYIASNTKISIR